MKVNKRATSEMKIYLQRCQRAEGASRRGEHPGGGQPRPAEQGERLRSQDPGSEAAGGERVGGGSDLSSLPSCPLVSWNPERAGVRGCSPLRPASGAPSGAEERGLEVQGETHR